MTNHSISADRVFALCQSQSQFPIDFDDAWQWIGYTRKDNAKRALLSCGFEEGIDLLINEELGTLDSPRAEECIMLTVDCFKMWAMMAGTEKGRETRIYFLQCERKMKQTIQISSTKPKSLLDLSPTKLYRLAAHQLSVESGKKPNPELVEGIDREYLDATGDAAFCAYHKSSYEIAKGTKLANDALREIGCLESSEAEKQEEDDDIVEFAQYAQDLDSRFAGVKDFYRFESHQLTLAGNN